MAVAPMVGGRFFPAVAQLGIGHGTVLNQSRVTFRGQRGTVIVFWSARFSNPAAVGKDQVRINAVGTAVGNMLLVDSDGWLAAAAGIGIRPMTAWVFHDPADGSFAEVAVGLSAGTVDLGVNGGRVMFMSFEPGVAAGPVVTIS